MNCYEELTINQISQKLNKSKVTIINHLKGLSDLGLLKKREELLKGPLIRKYYSLDPFSFLPTITTIEDFESLTSEEKWAFLSIKANYKRFEFEFMKNFITQIIPYWTHLQKKIMEYQDAKAEYSEDFYEEKKIRHYIYPMNEDEYNIYLEELNLM